MSVYVSINIHINIDFNCKNKCTPLPHGTNLLTTHWNSSYQIVHTSSIELREVKIQLRTFNLLNTVHILITLIVMNNGCGHNYYLYVDYKSDMIEAHLIPKRVLP